MAVLLDDKLWFPNPLDGDDVGLLAFGGDLSIDRLILAYSHVIFPWYSFRDKIIMWWCPLKRFVIFPNEIHISHSMRTLINKNRYTITINRDFDGVIHGCSEKRIDEDGAWLGEDMIKAYTELHNQNLAASVEVWDGDNLVGGLYGVTLGKCFFGESMFSRVPNASKFALIYLAKVFSKHGGVMIDCQLETSHLKSMGGRYISYDEYMKYVNM